MVRFLRFLFGVPVLTVINIYARILAYLNGLVITLFITD